jgi:SAM-dependent methyltransferase
VVGVDLDTGPAPLPLVRGDIDQLPFPNGSADAIFVCAVLQHLAEPLVALIEARRIVHPRSRDRCRWRRLGQRHRRPRGTLAGPAPCGGNRPHVLR